MSWLSKALGLDKPKNKALKDKINAVGRDALSLAEYALKTNLKQLVEDRDFDAFRYRMKSELAVILTAKTASLKDEIINDLLAKLQ